ncbi:peroxisomal targeting signal 1 receptor [Trichoplusia ni]|uniref:Peroxisomal targeting signal 1 receptor n=1 Tax=Trichoplusia ni TaxID=7111 RepID=A0A7E5V8T5_TRINI|nr:peroxisomal targeting signal 1 receptor [Trichoplusia ni]
MSINKLVGVDCGGNNSLVQLSNIVRRDASLQQPQTQSDRFVQEFMAQNSQIPQTFNMNTLLNNLPKDNIQKSSASTSRVPDVAMHMNRPWGAAGPSSSFMPHTMMPNFPMMQQPMLPSRPMSNVQIQYVNESDIEMTNNDVKAKAQEYVETMKDDDEMAYNQFMSFMKKISAGELNLGASEQTDERKMSREDILDEMIDKYKDEWDKLSDVTNYWDTEAANGIAKEYTFTEGNVMLENKSALDIGKEKLKMGDIPGAVLCFEAAVQQQPDSAEAWFLLGTTQAENEQDPLAITALKKSLQINPTQLEGYITLAAAYTNENMSKYAFVSLLDWLKASPKYSDIFPQDIDPRKLDIKELEAHVKSLYLKAVQLNLNQIDPDVQNALGVVFNISQEYDKAVDCFKTALMVASDNAKLWNRLGATLANSDRSEEAVDAYHKALHLEPGFIRARYNVGITCMNLGAHRQAAEHFLVALNQQHKAKSLFPDSSNTDTSSSTIWTTLRMVCSFMGEHDVAKLVDDRNLDELNKFFEIE